jgi:hypothetical protein
MFRNTPPVPDSLGLSRFEVAVPLTDEALTGTQPEAIAGHTTIQEFVYYDIDLIIN